jgi:hypothetical protein
LKGGDTRGVGDDCTTAGGGSGIPGQAEDSIAFAAAANYRDDVGRGRVERQR